MATDYRHKAPNVIYKPMIPFCYLKIKDKVITKDSKQWIMDEASKVPIHQYYKDKFKWSWDTLKSINWTIQRETLNTYDENDQRRILKMVHGWLPTYDCLHRELQVMIPRCPLCHYLMETNLHLFACKHKDQQDTFHKITQFIDNDSNGPGHSTLNEIIKMALAKYSTDKNKWTPAMTV